MAETNNLNLFTSNLVNLPDPVKAHEFQCIFETTTDSPLYKLFGNSDDLTIRARKVSVPQKDFGELSTEYLGMKRVFPGKAVVNGTTGITFDEFQDLFITKTMHLWQSYIFNNGIYKDIGINNANIGAASSNYLRDYSCTLKIYMYDSALSKLLPYYYLLTEVYPKTDSGFELNYETDGKIQKEITFNYNNFEVVDSTTIS